MATSLPLLALRCFVEVGQRGRQHAAHALSVTPGAVSQQIGCWRIGPQWRFLLRERSGLRLTEAGASVHPALLQAFEQMQEAGEFSGGDQVAANPDGQHGRHLRRLVAGVAPGPLQSASSTHRSTGRVLISAVMDLRRDRIDVALRHGLGGLSQPAAVTQLMAPVLVPVASPAFMAAIPG